MRSAPERIRIRIRVLKICSVLNYTKVLALISFATSEIVRHGGVAVSVGVSSYRATRNDVQNMVGGDHTSRYL